jgi:CTD nuclear envelope phosphatase 1
MVLSTLLAGPRYLFSGLYDENGNFSAWRSDDGSTRKSVNAKQKEDPASVMADRGTQEAYSTALAHRRDSSGSALSASSDEDAFGKDTEMLNARAEKRSAASTRSSDQSADTKDAVAGSTEEVAPRRSTRIKIASPEGARPPRARRGPPEPLRPRSGDLAAPATLKSPISPKESTARITRYPRAPAPPRPLVPQRRASYAPSTLPLYNPAHKTLILDLDETLIHSMSKGGRMGEGYMVEVRLRTSVGANGIVIGPQVPILYWVEKRPYCDEFLRKVCSFSG